MHQHRLAVRRSCLRSRSVATAVKPRAPPDLDRDPVVPAEWALPRQPITPSKWALPTSRTHTQPSSASIPNKWTRALPSSPNSSDPNGRMRSRQPTAGIRPPRDHVLSQQRQSITQRISTSHFPPDTGAPANHGGLRSPSQTTSPRTDNKISEWSEYRDARSGRPNRVPHKGRGSLLLRSEEDENIQLPIQRPTKVKKKSRIIEKKVTADVYIPSTVSVGTLARLLGLRLEHLQRRMRQVGMAEEAEYDHVLTSDYAALLVEEFGRNPIVNDEAAFDIYPPPPHLDPTSLKPRPPVVTIMGHVDHGKTTLLDSLRSSSVAKGEAGGITQHIGAFSVPVPPPSGSSDGPRSITFLDTPGHAAFSAMRARGARVTDIIVLVVAADDGVMPQTREVINLIKKDLGKVGVVVALNKVDKPNADVDAIHTALFAEHLQLEAVGGDIPSVEVSGLTGRGLPTLVETLSAMAEMQDLRAEHDGPVQGYVLESKVHKGLGPVATVLVLRGSLKSGSHIISGVHSAKVRVMSDSTGAILKIAHPGMAVTVSGWKTLPNAGDEVLQGTEAEVKKALANRQRKAEIEATLADVEVINSSRRQDRERREIGLASGDTATRESLRHPDGLPKELRLIIKADVSGSAEALEGALQEIGNKEASTRIVVVGVGDITESDVMRAKAVGGMIVGFSVSAPKAIETLAAQNDIPISMSNVIYRLMDDIKNRVVGLLPLIVETRVTGEATVLRLFDIQLKAKQTKKVAGCRVTNGVVEKSKGARLVRNGAIVHEGLLDTMRVLKKDVVDVRKGTECGLCFGAAFGDIQEGDVIQVYEKIEKPGIL